MGEGPLIELPRVRPVDLEIKPTRPGILNENLIGRERTKISQVDDLIVFGQGPVLDAVTREKPTGDTAQPDINFWSKTIARAAGELKRAGVVKRIVLTGGRTGGDDFPSEAELMKKVLVEEYGIAEEDIVLEDKAKNTLENMAYTLNHIDTAKATDPQNHNTVGLLGSDFHLRHIHLLAERFGIVNPGGKLPQGFSAEQVFRVIAYKTGDTSLHEKLDKLLHLEDDLSPNSMYPEEIAPAERETRVTRISSGNYDRLSQDTQPRSTVKAPTAFETQIGAEAKGFRERLLDKQRWIYGLHNEPTYWIGYGALLDNPERFRTFLKAAPPDHLRAVGVEIPPETSIDTLEPAALDTIRETLKTYLAPGQRKITGIDKEVVGIETSPGVTQ